MLGRFADIRQLPALSLIDGAARVWRWAIVTRISFLDHRRIEDIPTDSLYACPRLTGRVICPLTRIRPRFTRNAEKEERHQIEPSFIPHL